MDSKQTDRSGSGPATASVEPSQASQAILSEGGYAIHVVRRSETLESIAQDQLGDARRAREIAELNRDLLSLSEVNWLRPGMRLLLPLVPDPSPPR